MHNSTHSTRWSWWSENEINFKNLISIQQIRINKNVYLPSAIVSAAATSTTTTSATTPETSSSCRCTRSIGICKWVDQRLQTVERNKGNKYDLKVKISVNTSSSRLFHTYNNEMAVNIPKNIENTRDNDHGWLLYTFPSKKKKQNWMRINWISWL